MALNKLLENIELKNQNEIKDSVNIHYVVDYHNFGYFTSDKFINPIHNIIREELKKLGNNWIPENITGTGEKGRRSIGEIKVHYYVVKDANGISRLIISKIDRIIPDQYMFKKIAKKK